MLRRLAVVFTAVATVLVLLTGSANALTNVTYGPEPLLEHNGENVFLLWAYDYNPATNHLRGYVHVLGIAATHVKIDPLNLGDNNGVLESATGYTVDLAANPLEFSTDPVDCHKDLDAEYILNVHYSIRWTDGTLEAGETHQFKKYGVTVCRG